MAESSQILEGDPDGNVDIDMGETFDTFPIKGESEDINLVQENHSHLFAEKQNIVESATIDETLNSTTSSATEDASCSGAAFSASLISLENANSNAATSNSSPSASYLNKNSALQSSTETGGSPSSVVREAATSSAASVSETRDTRPRLSQGIAWNDYDCTLNASCLRVAPPAVSPTPAFASYYYGHQLLTTIGHSGLHFFATGIRANAGIRRGRYAFEVSIIDFSPSMPFSSGVASREGESTQSGGSEGGTLRGLIRIGVCTLAESVILGESKTSWALRHDGSIMAQTAFVKPSSPKRLGKGDVVTVVVALATDSTNGEVSPPSVSTNSSKSSTESNSRCSVSFYINGSRIGPSHKFDASVLDGKALYPCVTYRGAILMANFGASKQRARISSSVKFLQDAAEDDVEWNPIVRPESGQYDILFPVGIPNEGTFDWCDRFLALHPHKYTELSDRMLLDWAQRSGLQRIPQFRRRGGESEDCIDTPSFTFGTALLDSTTHLRRILRALALCCPRDFIVMEVKRNLTSLDRQQSLKDFTDPWFIKKAIVVVGDPPEDYRLWQYHLACEQKENLAASPSIGETTRTSESTLLNDDASKGNFVSASHLMKASSPEDTPSVILDPHFRFRKKEQEDLGSKTLAANLASFSLPTKEEGFNEIHYEWFQCEEANLYIKNWIKHHKMTTVMYDHQPSNWLTEKFRLWETVKVKWMAAHRSYRSAEQTAADERRWTAEKESLADIMEKLTAARAASLHVHTPPATKDTTLPSSESTEAEKPRTLEKGKDLENGTLDAEIPRVEEGLTDALPYQHLVDIYKEKCKAFESEWEKELNMQGDAAETATQDASEESPLHPSGSKKNEKEMLDTPFEIPMRTPPYGSGDVPVFMNFQPEDWKILDAHVEMHLLVHAFKRDVEDVDRQHIYVEHFPYYFRLYFDQQFRYDHYPSCTKMDDLIELTKGVVELSHPPCVLLPLLPLECPFSYLCKLTEKARRWRNLMLHAKLVDPLKSNTKNVYSPHQRPLSDFDRLPSRFSRNKNSTVLARDPSSLHPSRRFTGISPADGPRHDMRHEPRVPSWKLHQGFSRSSREYSVDRSQRRGGGDSRVSFPGEKIVSSGKEGGVFDASLTPTVSRGGPVHTPLNERGFDESYDEPPYSRNSTRFPPTSASSTGDERRPTYPRSGGGPLERSSLSSSKMTRFPNEYPPLSEPRSGWDSHFEASFSSRGMRTTDSRPSGRYEDDASYENYTGKRSYPPDYSGSSNQQPDYKRAKEESYSSSSGAPTVDLRFGSKQKYQFSQPSTPTPSYSFGGDHPYGSSQPPRTTTNSSGQSLRQTATTASAATMHSSPLLSHPVQNTSLGTTQKSGITHPIRSTTSTTMPIGGLGIPTSSHITQVQTTFPTSQVSVVATGGNATTSGQYGNVVITSPNYGGSATQNTVMGTFGMQTSSNYASSIGNNEGFGSCTANQEAFQAQQQAQYLNLLSQRLAQPLSSSLAQPVPQVTHALPQPSQIPLSQPLASLAQQQQQPPPSQQQPSLTQASTSMLGGGFYSAPTVQPGSFSNFATKTH